MYMQCWIAHMHAARAGESIARAGLHVQRRLHVQLKFLVARAKLRGKKRNKYEN